MTLTICVAIPPNGRTFLPTRHRAHRLQSVLRLSAVGSGKTALIERVVPLLVTLGASDSLIQQMGVETPARLLCWV